MHGPLNVKSWYWSNSVCHKSVWSPSVLSPPPPQTNVQKAAQKGSHRTTLPIRAIHCWLQPIFVIAHEPWIPVSTFPDPVQMEINMLDMLMVALLTYTLFSTESDQSLNMHLREWRHRPSVSTKCHEWRCALRFMGGFYIPSTWLVDIFVKRVRNKVHTLVSVQAING